MSEKTFPETKFSQDKPHAKCLSCDKILVTPDDLSAHLKESESVSGGRSHRARILDQTREQEVSGRVSRMIDEAMDTFCSSLDYVIQHNLVTEGEARKALQRYPDFEDAWREWTDSEFV